MHKEDREKQHLRCGLDMLAIPMATPRKGHWGFTPPREQVAPLRHEIRVGSDLAFMRFRAKWQHCAAAVSRPGCILTCTVSDLGIVTSRTCALKFGTSARTVSVWSGSIASSDLWVKTLHHRCGLSHYQLYEMQLTGFEDDTVVRPRVLDAIALWQPIYRFALLRIYTERATTLPLSLYKTRNKHFVPSQVGHSPWYEVRF
jgi:hypothetical protein